MDENTSPVSTPGSENASSLRERFSPLQSKTNKSSYEIKSDDAKKSPSSSPLRSPMSEKNVSMFTPPYINRQSLKSFPPRSSSPIDRHRQQQQQQQQQRLQLHTDKNDGDRDTNVLQPKQQKQQQSTTSPTDRHSIPVVDNSKLQQQQQQQQQKEQKHALRQEIDVQKATLEKQRQYTATLVTWESSMMELINQFKELRADVDDSVDILVESDQVLVELEADKEKQDQVDELMNLIPQRLFEIEQLKNQHSL